LSRWGLLLIVSAFVIGLSRVEGRKAVRISTWATVIVVTGVSIKIGAL